MVRLFVGFPTPPEAPSNFQEQWHWTYHYDLRWTKAPFHVTLRFLNVTKDIVPDLIERLKTVQAPVFQASYGVTGIFTRKDRDGKIIPTVLYLSVEPAQTISHLHDLIEKALEGLKISRDSRFIPHVTLGRFIFHTKPTGRLLSQPAPISVYFPVNAFHLYESKPTAGGHEHNILATYPLQS